MTFRIWNFSNVPEIRILYHWNTSQEGRPKLFPVVIKIDILTLLNEFFIFFPRINFTFFKKGTKSDAPFLQTLRKVPSALV